MWVGRVQEHNINQIGFFFFFFFNVVFGYKMNEMI